MSLKYTPTHVNPRTGMTQPCDAMCMVSLPMEVKQLIERLAKNETRPMSALVRRLILEALAARARNVHIATSAVNEAVGKMTTRR